MNIRTQFQHKMSIQFQELIKYQQQKYKKPPQHEKQRRYSSLKYTHFLEA